MELRGSLHATVRGAHRSRSFYAMFVGVAPGLHDLPTSGLLIGSIVLPEDGLLPAVRESLPR